MFSAAVVELIALEAKAKYRILSNDVLLFCMGQTDKHEQTKELNLISEPYTYLLAL
jgi:hypothetical protein